MFFVLLFFYIFNTVLYDIQYWNDDNSFKEQIEKQNLLFTACTQELSARTHTHAQCDSVSSLEFISMSVQIN